MSQPTTTEPTYQQIVEIIKKRIDDKIREVRDLKQPLRMDYEFDSQFDFAIDNYRDKQYTLGAVISEQSHLLAEITGLKDSTQP